MNHRRTFMAAMVAVLSMSFVIVSIPTPSVHGAPLAKKKTVCKLVTKSIKGEKQKVKVCHKVTVKPKPTATPKPTVTQTPTATPTITPTAIPATWTVSFAAPASDYTYTQTNGSYEITNTNYGTRIDLSFFSLSKSLVNGPSYEVTIPGSGGKRKTISAKSKSEVQRKLREAQLALTQGTLSVGKSQTVTQWLTHWLEHMVRPVKSPSTYENYEISVRKHIVPEIGHVRLGELQPEHFQRLYAAATKKGLAPRTVKKLHLVMHKSLADAVLLKKLPYNPADHIGPLYLPREKGQSAQRAFTPEQVSTLFSATRDDALHALWFTLASTGMRLGEALGITWQDVDLEQGTIHIHRSIKREKNRGLILREHTKTLAGTRTIEVNSLTVDILQRHREAQRSMQQSASRWENREGYKDLVFTTQFGTALDPSDTWKFFLRALEQAGLPRIRIHDLRHSAATNMLLNGEDIKAVSEHLGHQDVSTTLRVYYHVTRGKRRDAVERLGQLYASMEPQPQ